jgi:hypothetical protein
MATTDHKVAVKEVQQRVFDFDWTKIENPFNKNFKPSEELKRALEKKLGIKL